MSGSCGCGRQWRSPRPRRKSHARLVWSKAHYEAVARSRTWPCQAGTAAGADGRGDARIRSAIPSVVKAIQRPGDTVKSFEPVLQIRASPG